MNPEQESQQERSPQQRRIFNAENAFLNARSVAMPEPLAAKHAAKWNAIGVERDRIPEQAWKKLAEYVDANSMDHPSLTDIMQAAIEKRLSEKPPETYSEVAPEKEQAVLQLLSEPEFTENEQPFVDLEELYTEYKTIAKKYSVPVATEYWLFTRTVDSMIERQLQNTIQGSMTQGLGNTLYRELSAYLANRASQELQLDQIETRSENNQQEQQFTSIDKLYSAYKAFTRLHTGENAYLDELEWLASLDLVLSPEERKQLAGSPTLYQEDTALSQRTVAAESNALSNEQLKGLRRLLDKRLRAEKNERNKAIDAQREVIEQPRKKERKISPNKKELNGIIATILEQVEPLLEGDPKEVSDTLVEVAEQEYPRLPEHIKAYLEQSTQNSETQVLQNTPLDLFTRLLITQNGSRALKKKDTEKEEAASLPWYKRIFRRK